MARRIRPALVVGVGAALLLGLTACVPPGVIELITGGDRSPAPAATPATGDHGGDGSAPTAAAPNQSSTSWIPDPEPPIGVAPILLPDPPLLLMTEEWFSRINTVQGITFARSSPDATWNVGKGFPAEFPVGLPVYPDRWVKGYPLVVESGGLLMLSYTFWGGYDEVGAILAELERQGYEVESQILPDRQAHIAESADIRVVITVAEGVTDIQEPSRVYDPQYNYNIKFLDIPYSEPRN